VILGVVNEWILKRQNVLLLTESSGGFFKSRFIMNKSTSPWILIKRGGLLIFLCIYRDVQSHLALLEKSMALIHLSDF
jgi:hypothetical protein